MTSHLKTLAVALAGATASAGAVYAAPAEAPAAVQPATATCTGVVTDSEGEPLIGASVVVPGTTIGGSTNFNGEFSLANVPVGSTIRISYVGYETVEVKWNGNAINVSLTENNMLDEVVVVGFGTQKKINLTGAVSAVSAKELTNRPVSSVSDALQGLVPGLNVLSSSLGGQLNGTRTMNIRGTGTIGTGASVTPLVLIDGMEGTLETVAPQDVESISILKDASASSIYGIRAAGGVILVTTKKGKEGKVSVNYSNSFRFSHVTRMPEKMDSYNYAIMMNEGSINNGGGQWLPDAKVEQIKNYMQNPSGPSMFRNPNTNYWEVWDVVDIIPIANVDYLDEHFGKTAFSQEHNISVNGGSEKVNYLFSGTLLDQDGILRYGDDRLRRYNLNGRATVKITNWLTFGYSTRWWRNDYNGPSLIGDNGSNQFYHDVMRYWNMIPVKDPNGHYVRETYIPALTEGGRFKKATDQLAQQFTVNINPLEGLNVHAEMNYRTQNQNTHRYYFETYSYDCDDQPYANKASAMPGSTSVYDYNYRQNYFNPNVYADYSFTLNETSNFKVMAGFQAEWLNYKSFSAQRTDILNNIPWLDTTNGTATVSGGTATWSTAGWFGRINYDYAGRYLVEANIRYDGTSRFRSGNRWSTSPSFSLGWNIAQEAFMEDARGVLNTLKLRGSWGRLGNQNTNSWYPTYSNMGYSASSGGWLIDGTRPTLASQPGLVASTLTWEKNQTWDIGLDWGLLNNRLSGNFDYYQRKTLDMVGPGPDLPDVLGATVPNINSISMTSKGWEVTLNWRDRIQDFSYGISLNLSDYQIYIDEYDNNPSKSLSIGTTQHGPYYNGAKLGNIWGYKVIGIAKTDAEMAEHLSKVNQSALGSRWAAGDLMYADLDGDGVVNTGKNTEENPGDRVVIGNTTPRYSFGVNIDAQWKGFDLRVFLQGVGKRDYWASGAVFQGPCANNQWQAAGLVQHLDYFRPEGTSNPLGPNVDSYYPRPNWGGGKNFQQSDRYIQDASYCRLKNVTIGYTLPQTITRRAYIENLRVFFSGENLATLTHFTGTGDPELVDSYFNAYGYGKVYPLQRVLSFGLNVTF
ncbi:MAG: TonB-dependent receptor [Bacteroides sp.]|nr:TonB-dependent receptor [Bacteroides sp.]